MQDIPLGEIKDVKDAVSVLFSERPMGDKVVITGKWDRRHDVDEEELNGILSRAKSGKTPGPDGVAATTCALGGKIIGARMRSCYTKCLRTGSFPSKWKMALLIFVPKSGKPGGGGRPPIGRCVCWTKRERY